MKNLLLIACLSIIVSCADKGPDTQKVQIENRYSMEIPNLLSKATDLNAEASLQYQNLYSELYIIVLDETKKSVFDAIQQNNLTDVYSLDFEGYVKMMIDNYSNSITLKEKSAVKDTLVNTLKMKKFNITGVYNNLDAFFMFSFVEGKERFYQIMTWTLSDRKSTHEKTMNDMVNSFKEL